jgi:hypothetical protein
LVPDKIIFKPLVSSKKRLGKYTMCFSLLSFFFEARLAGLKKKVGLKI